MNKLIMMMSMVFGISAANAESFPELYCVSAKSFGRVNQINLFTNKKGTMRINLQFYATDGQEEGCFDTGYLQTVTKLEFDSSTGVMTNGTGKLALQVNKKAITPKQADAVFDKNAEGSYYDMMNPPGHRIDFKKYYLAKMISYNMPGKKGYWDSSLMEGFKAGVTEYVCGNAKDMIGARPSIFDGGND